MDMHYKILEYALLYIGPKTPPTICLSEKPTNCEVLFVKIHQLQYFHSVVSGLSDL